MGHGRAQAVQAADRGHRLVQDIQVTKEIQQLSQEAIINQAIPSTRGHPTRTPYRAVTLPQAPPPRHTRSEPDRPEPHNSSNWFQPELETPRQRRIVPGGVTVEGWDGVASALEVPGLGLAAILEIKNFFL